MFTKKLRLALLATTLVSGLCSTAAHAEQPIIGLITKTNTNPFFAKMKEGAAEAAAKYGVDFRSFSGKFDSDNQTQVDAVENLISAGAKGILITPADTTAIVPTIKKARDAGILVIALDTPLDPIDAADATFSTDNFLAGQLIGEWAAKTMGDKAKDAKIALLDLNTSGMTVDVLRDQGFLKGFGVDIKDPNRIGDETDPRIVGHAVSDANEEGGRRAMENLLQKDPDTNLVYTINEPAAAGAFEAIKAIGAENKILLVSIDGGCPGVRNVQAGVIGATSMQFPLVMASKGIEAVVDFIKTGKKPAVTPGLKFTNTGTELVTDKPVPGLPSMDTKEGLKKCWG